jgi:hypothetical protein
MNEYNNDLIHVTVPVYESILGALALAILAVWIAFRHTSDLTPVVGMF